MDLTGVCAICGEPVTDMDGTITEILIFEPCPMHDAHITHLRCAPPRIQHVHLSRLNYQWN